MISASRPSRSRSASRSSGVVGRGLAPGLDAPLEAEILHLVDMAEHPLLVGQKPGPMPFHIPLSWASTNQCSPSSISSTRGAESFHFWARQTTTDRAAGRSGRCGCRRRSAFLAWHGGHGGHGGLLLLLRYGYRTRRLRRSSYDRRVMGARQMRQSSCHAAGMAGRGRAFRPGSCRSGSAGRAPACRSRDRPRWRLAAATPTIGNSPRPLTPIGLTSGSASSIKIVSISRDVGVHRHQVFGDIRVGDAADIRVDLGLLRAGPCRCRRRCRPRPGCARSWR